MTASLGDAVLAAGIEDGVAARRIRPDDDLDGVEVLLAVGYPELFLHMLRAPRTSARVLWFGEPLSRPATVGTSTVRGALHDPWARPLRRAASRLPDRVLPERVRRIRADSRSEGQRRANARLAVEAARLVDRVVVTSRDRAVALRALGIEAEVVPFGYHAAFAGPLTSPLTNRDIDILVLGSALDLPSSRRSIALGSIRPQLDHLGHVVVAGGVWGAPRDALVARARTLLDIQRIPGNFTGLRFLIAAAGGAAFVSEPMDDPHPLVSGSDHLEVSIDRIPATLAQILADEALRVHMVERAQNRLRADLSMAQSMRRVLRLGNRSAHSPKR